LAQDDRCDGVGKRVMSRPISAMISVARGACDPGDLTQEGQRRQRARQPRYLARVLGDAAVSAGGTDTFLGERYRRIAHRRGKKRAIVAVGRSILVIAWHLLSDDTIAFHDLGPDYYDSRVNLSRKMRNHVRELQALGYKVTLEAAA